MSQVRRRGGALTKASSALGSELVAARSSSSSPEAFSWTGAPLIETRRIPTQIPARSAGPGLPSLSLRSCYCTTTHPTADTLAMMNGVVARIKQSALQTMAVVAAATHLFDQDALLLLLLPVVLRLILEVDVRKVVVV